LPDSKAGAAQQPLVQQTANGIPLVQITAPTAAGVSRNLYTDFNVPERGAVLNNAYKVTNTKLAGYVQANPNLVRGTAKLIVNEVTGTKQTAIKGFLEVAGDRAGVIVANPNGIAVNGGGFLNTSRAMLTTGRPLYAANGDVASLQVTDGIIQIDGKGFDASQTDQVDLLARAVQLNAGVWAKDAHVVTGRNDVAYGSLAATPLASEKDSARTAPKVALDVAALGGMYANRIYLVGTEKGLGVNIGGTMAASQSLALENNGDLHIARTGTAYSEADLNIHTTGTVTNEQTLASGGKAVIRADKGLVNTGVVGAGVSRDGKVQQKGQLTVKTTALKNDNAQVVSGGSLDVQAKTVSNREGEVSAQGDAVVQVAQNIDMEKGKVAAKGNLTIQADALPLHGVIASGGNAAITAHQSLSNDQSAENMGDITADGNLTLHTDGTLTNRRRLESGKALKLEANRVVNHESGRIYGSDVTIQTDRLENRTQAVLEEKLASAMKTLQEKEEALEAAYAADVTKYTGSAQEAQYKAAIAGADKDYEAQLAVVKAVQAELETHKAGTIAARNSLNVQAGTIENQHHALLYSDGDMTLAAADRLVNRGASIESMGSLKIKAEQIHNENDAFSAKRIGSEWKENPEKIRIDQAGHPEQGESFDRSEFSNLSSGYGAYHHPKAMPTYAPAYDMVEAPGPGETADSAHPAGSRIPNYEWNDHVFQTFGLTPMATSRPETAGEAQTAWDSQFQSLLDQLDEKITAYNAQAEKHNAALGLADSQKIHNYTIIRSHFQTSHEEVQSTNAGVLRSGQAMQLDGAVYNTNSQITAGTTLTASGAVVNAAKENQERTVTFGTTQGSYTYKRHWPHKSRRRGYHSEVFMTPQVALSNTSSLAVGAYTDHGTAPTRQDITEAARNKASSYLDPFSLDTKNPVSTPASWQMTAARLTSSLYTLHPETTAKYLVETDPAFTNKRRFLSSDYMYQQLQWDPDKVPKRLGDGFYEQALIRSQILDRTGRRYLGDYTDDLTQYKALMDAGIAYAKATGLTPGVSLSAAQAAALTSDMVWLETREVTVNGQKESVVYPHVYLRAGSAQQLLADGSLISANTLIIDTKDAVRNSGTLAGKTVRIQAGSVANAGTVQGQDIAIASERISSKRV
ncbi:filamentous hemagglutinin N-terminal domain-containing protein, partial [Mitsuokella sp.]|uniref:filamentous hemagglutinin N-terminal domain-containing protein n=1 Tax=Mitsuokella sp. TaxID=2049034 RepID=UPI002A7F6A0C